MENKLKKLDLVDDFYSLAPEYRTKAKLREMIKENYTAKEEVREIVGPVDEDFLAQSDCEDYSGEWSINKDRQRILKELSSPQLTD